MGAVPGCGCRVAGVRKTAWCLTVLVAVQQASWAAAAGFERRWVYASETSAVLYWTTGDVTVPARSYVEYETPGRERT